VTLVHRNERFDRIKPANREALEAAQAQGKLVVKTQAKPLEITAESVRLEGPEGSHAVDNDYVFVCIGGELPSAWLAKIGVEVRTFRGEAHPAAQA
jgi:thioredoxin reductase